MLFGSWDQPLNDNQIPAREGIAQLHGAEFRVGSGGKTTFSLPMSDLGDTARFAAVREAIKAADLSLNDGAPLAKR